MIYFKYLFNRKVNTEENCSIYKSCCLTLSHDCNIQKLAAAIRKLLFNKTVYQNNLLQFNRNKNIRVNEIKFKNFNDQNSKNVFTKTRMITSQ